MTHASPSSEIIPPVILASASPRRVELLERAGLRFRQLKPKVEERDEPGLDPEALVRANAALKAGWVANRHPEALVIGADTTVALDGEIFFKPGDLAEARRMLARLAGRTHQVWTGVSLIHRASRREETWAESAEVTFLPFGERVMDRYIEAVNPLDKAGAYGIQEKSEWIIKSYSGSKETIMGLPLRRLCRKMNQWFPLIGPSFEGGGGANEQ